MAQAWARPNTQAAVAVAGGQSRLATIVQPLKNAQAHPIAVECGGRRDSGAPRTISPAARGG
jgi:hypothetical protein